MHYFSHILLTQIILYYIIFYYIILYYIITAAYSAKEAKSKTRYQLHENTVKNNHNFIVKQYIVYNVLHVH
jgi:hypothetical protein